VRDSFKKKFAIHQGAVAQALGEICREVAYEENEVNIQECAKNEQAFIAVQAPK